MAFTQLALPFASDALESYGMKAETFEYHYGKHHKAYVDNLNKLVDGTELANKSLEEVIQIAFGDSAKAGIFNNAAQVWNHSFFWNCLKPAGGGAPTGALAAKIEEDFGSFEKFKEEFSTAAATQFGSGWAWLVDDGGTLKVIKTPNAENPLAHGKKALLTIDVWEHAYYIDFKNARPGFIKNFLDNLVNWDFVAANFAKA
ncbi:MAG: superoxide dismutase [Nostocales cyanobacterium LE14-WE4]|jgi:Fe-Mn family superoxide dismutase|uniref:superoxide dismutase n=1 Tax=Anabaena sp. AL09 TaxID=1710891 RepID=UPI0007FDF8FF|nr:superoxide dismutase [Anabaena sp. AL09]MCE2697902.1 superoxide dismutase [Anabaena sp. 49633_E8]MDJ0501238.1 superoxide dismutase [Nostocales cyanobacterium LE14-WE4]OBQ11929.1 MAG: superoxide dismutase [Anabaena sp. LE011-02]MCE2702224.1 superoxide dismutase [Anabaena sp. 49633_E8]OBQ14002.1 MAG: superoxide dismutase [Anabaena sp. AL09]